MSALLLAFLLMTMSSAFAGDPQFDSTTSMRRVLVPIDAAVDSVIYRLRATDPEFDYPLQFELLDEGAKSVVRVDTLPCSRYNSVCQANVVLQRRLEVGRIHDFRVRVRDTKGGSNTMTCSIVVTNGTTPKDSIFPRIPDFIMVPEDAKRGTELGFVVARKSPLSPKPVYLELWGSSLFAIRQKVISPETTEGTIFLLGPLDFETQSMYHLTVLANDAYVESKSDSRNIAGLAVVVVVRDVQDRPPVFTLAPPVTRLTDSLVPGDVVVRVHAEDGDRGAPRPIRYGLVSEGNPFTPFFNISVVDGEIVLVRSLDEITAISHPGVPILLTVVAEEVRTNRDEPPAQSTTVQLAFLLGERGNEPPYFGSDNYVTRIDENAPLGTTLVFSDPYIPEVSDDDMGKNGVFALTLDNNNGTFEITPNVGERKTNFIIKVRDSMMLDYETRKSVTFKIIAQELTPISNQSTSVSVTVFINDVNDNPPVFLQKKYEVTLPENMTAGTRIVQVTAEDIDTGLFGKVRYTQILGHLNTSLILDPTSGVITVATDNHGFDREALPEYVLHIEARDEDGNGNRAIVPLVIKLIDINDCIPEFEKPLYEFILSRSFKNFTNPAIIHAYDSDATEPNNVVRYEISNGNYENKFALDSITGELTLLALLTKDARRRRGSLRSLVNNDKNKDVEELFVNGKDAKGHIVRKKRQASQDEVFILIARAYDMGIPHLSSTCEIRIYPPESKARTMMFIVAGKYPDRKKTEEVLASLTGGRVTIQEVRPYSGKEVGATDVTTGMGPVDKSVVIASVLYNSNSVVDVSNLQEKFTTNSTVVTTHIVGNQETPITTRREYRGDSGTLLWILIFLVIIIFIALLLLVLCCMCEGCPLYIPPSKRAIRVKSTQEDTHLVHTDISKDIDLGHENKGVQAEWNGRSGRKEAWSADISDSRTKPTSWKFNRRNQFNKQAISMNGYDNGSPPNDMQISNEKSTLRLRDGPNVTYTKEIQKKHQRKHQKHVYIEDADGDYVNVNRIEYQDTKLPNQADDDADADSLKRHEIERGSDTEYRDTLRRGLQKPRTHLEDDDYPQTARDQLFIRDGNTEILRLITRGRPDDQQPNQGGTQQQYIMVDNGKDILMQRFIEQQQILNATQLQQDYVQKTEANIQKSGAELQVDGDMQVPEATPQPETPNRVQVQNELLETSLRQQNELLRQILLEKEQILQKQEDKQEDNKFETQSLPAHSVMATQTDCEAETQTEFELMRPQKRKTRSDNDDSFSEDNNDYEVYIVGEGDDVNGIRWSKRRKYYKRKRAKIKEMKAKRIAKILAEIQRKIKTPIIEESESSIETLDKHIKNKGLKGQYEQIHLTKKQVNDLLKQQDEILGKNTESDGRVNSGLKKEVLIEISDSLGGQSPIKKQHSKLEKQCATFEYHDSDEDSENDAIYSVKVGKFKEVFSDDSLDSFPTNGKDFLNTNVIYSGNRDKRNLVFSRQGSSTDAKETSEHDIRNFSKRSSFENDDDNHPSAFKSSYELLIPPENDKIKIEICSDQPHSVESDRIKKPSHPQLKERHPIFASQAEGRKAFTEDKKLDVSKSVPRYMQWYKNKKERSKVSRESIDNSSNKSKVNSEPHVTKKIKKDVRLPGRASKSSIGKDESAKPKRPSLKESQQKTISNGRPLLQHSEHRYEHMYPHSPSLYAQPVQISQHIYTSSDNERNIDLRNANTQTYIDNNVNHSDHDHLNLTVVFENDHENSNNNNTQPSLRVNALEDDRDSGIVMNTLVHGALRKPPITEKKSVFTIAYDDMHTKKIRASSDTPPY